MGGRQLTQLWGQILHGRTKIFLPYTGFHLLLSIFGRTDFQEQDVAVLALDRPPSLYKQNKNLSQDSLQSFLFDTAANHHGPSAARPPRQSHDGHLHRQFQR